MQKKMRALIMGATALATSFMLAGTAAASGPDCGGYAQQSRNYCDSLSGMDGANCMIQLSQAQMQCMNILMNATMSETQRWEAANRLSWPGR
ncbi:hypothetical protein [Streptomyces sp. NPDC085540]|uniref:hypothetical protein n=1 Tax=Streptomyces sp. NPDC085540 TaxID=3365730 RepID=UPI0037CDA0F3